MAGETRSQAVSDPANRLQIVLWKWANPNKLHIIFDFSAEAVNRLRRQLAEHLGIPHDVVCITDNPSGIDSGIRVIPLWQDAAHLGGCWRRLRAFAPDMATIIGPRFAWIDLDSVIVGPMDDVLGRREPLVLYRSNSVEGTPYNGSMLLMDAGARARVWDGFDPGKSPAIVKAAGFTGTDQAWISHVLGPDEAVWTSQDGVMHFMRDCVPDLPAHSRIVFFPGVQKMHMPNARRHAPWIDQRFFENGEPRTG
jgi:hypothetical protein